jgi:subtilase family serine protease
MKASRLAVTASLAAIALASAGAAAADSWPRLNGHVAKWVANATKVGTADSSQTVKLSAFLGFRNPDQLTKLIAAQSTKGSPEYNHHLTAAQFDARFAPTSQAEAKVEAALRGLGFRVVSKPPSNLFVEFTGTVGQVKSVFGVSQDVYSYQGKIMRANVEGPRMPASLSGLVTAITGLDETGQLIHPFHKSINDDAAEFAPAAAAKAVASTVSPAVTLPVAANLPSPFCSNYYGDTVATLSTAPAPYSATVPWLVCAYNPQQIQAAYGVNKSTITGAGVTVAIVDAFASPTLQGDANHYFKNHGLPLLKAGLLAGTPGANFDVIYGGDLKTLSDNAPCGPQGWFGEISLDVEAVHTVAKGANILYSGGLSCSGVDLVSAVYTVIDGTATLGGPLADIITNSYGFTGEPLSQAELDVETAVFEQAAAEGVTITFSSGDNADIAFEFADGLSEASWPAASPLVTAVGGTSLGLKNASGAKSEWGWGTFRSYLSGATVNSATSVTTSGLGPYAFYAGAGGGVSFQWLEPSYQVGVVYKGLADRTYDLNGKIYAITPNDRVVPDVAMDADPYTGFLIGESYLIAGDPISDAGCTPTSATVEYCEAGIGGTSLASPLFAGVLALVDQLRQANGYGDIGFLNPYLYSLKIGPPASTTTPLADVQAPTSPTAVLRGYANNLNRVRLVTINSVPGPVGPSCKTSFCSGQDGFLLETTPKYDNVTGVGTPYVPAFIAALGTAP